MVDTQLFFNYLNSKNLKFYSGVPDSLLADLCSCISERAEKNKHFIAANEGNAVAICAGHYLATKEIGVVYMQNSGEGNIVNPILSLADEEVYSIPMLLLIGWRGEPGKHDEPQHVKQGKVTCDLLKAMQVEFCIADDNFQQQLDYAVDYMKEKEKPYAIVIKKGYFSKYGYKPEPLKFEMTREDALKAIIGEIGDDIIVSTTGKTSREIFEIREKNCQGHDNDFLTVGSMGHTSSIAFGLSLGTDKTVWCIDGDGSMIMHMGGIGVIAPVAPRNFKYIINDNHAHESVGGQPTCAGNLDIPAILKGCGFKRVLVAENESQVKESLKIMKAEDSVALILHTKQGARSDLGRPTTTPVENKKALMKKLGNL